MSGVDSAKAAPHGGSGYHIGHREYPMRNCGEGAVKPGCGKPFKPETPNGRYCAECRKPKPSRFQWEP